MRLFGACVPPRDGLAPEPHGEPGIEARLQQRATEVPPLPGTANRHKRQVPGPVRLAALLRGGRRG